MCSAPRSLLSRRSKLACCAPGLNGSASARSKPLTAHAALNSTFNQPYTYLGTVCYYRSDGQHQNQRSSSSPYLTTLDQNSSKSSRSSRMSDKPLKTAHGPAKTVSAIKNKALRALWQRTPPKKDDKVAAFQLAMDVGATTDAEALHIMDVLFDHDFKANNQIGPVRQTLPASPCTALQGALVRPIVLQRLLDHSPGALNQKQLGFNATLLHIVGHLFAQPPKLMTAEASKVGPARQRLLQSARLLIAAGADPFIPDDLGSPPIEYAVQLAAVTGNTDFVQLLFEAMYGDGCKEFSASLKMKSDKIIAELLQLAKQARPIAAPHSSSSSSSSGGGSGSSDLEGVLELPPDALCRAHMLLTVARNKFKTYDQLIQLLPLAGVAKLHPHMLSIGQHLAGLQGLATNNIAQLQSSSQGMAGRVFVRACDVPMTAASLRAWHSAFKNNPRQLGLYAMLRYNTLLHRQLLQDRELLVAATQGAKALLTLARHVLETAGDSTNRLTTEGASSRSSSGGGGVQGLGRTAADAAAALQQQLPGFDDMAFTTSFLVSWLVIAAGIEEVTDRPKVFEVLGRPTGHHLDCLSLLELGQTKAARAAQSLCFYPDAAVDMLLRVAENGGSNRVNRQLAAMLNKVLKRALKGKPIEDWDLRDARSAAGIGRGITSQLLALLYQHTDREDASHLLQQALPALSSLQGSAFGKALAATATTVKPTQFQPTATLGAVPGAATAMVTDAAEAIRGCALASYTLGWAATDPAVTAAAAAASEGDPLFSGGSSSSSSGGSVQGTSGTEQSETASRAILLSGLSAVASRFAGQHHLFRVLGATIGDATGRNLTISQQVQICKGQSLVAGANVVAGLGGNNNLLEMIGGILRDSPFFASPEVQAAQALPKRPDSCSGACWACGRTAEAAVAAGVQLQRGSDGKLRLKRCSRCQAAHYCSAECQQGHWKAHKPTCVPVGASSSGVGAQH